LNHQMHGRTGVANVADVAVVSKQTTTRQRTKGQRKRGGGQQTIREERAVEGEWSERERRGAEERGCVSAQERSDQPKEGGERSTDLAQPGSIAITTAIQQASEHQSIQGIKYSSTGGGWM